MRPITPGASPEPKLSTTGIHTGLPNIETHCRPSLHTIFASAHTSSSIDIIAVSRIKRNTIIVSARWGTLTGRGALCFYSIMYLILLHMQYVPLVARHSDCRQSKIHQSMVTSSEHQMLVEFLHKK
jgi:hypothetical protein